MKGRRYWSFTNTSVVLSLACFEEFGQRTAFFRVLVGPVIETYTDLQRKLLFCAPIR
jgi:hypothetical protein